MTGQGRRDLGASTPWKSLTEGSEPWHHLSLLPQLADSSLLSFTHCDPTACAGLAEESRPAEHPPPPRDQPAAPAQTMEMEQHLENPSAPRAGLQLPGSIENHVAH